MAERPSNLSAASDGTVKEYCGAVRRRAYQDAAYWTTRYVEDAEPRAVGVRTRARARAPRGLQNRVEGP